MSERSVVIRLEANISGFRQKMAEAERVVGRFGKTGTESSTAMGRLAQHARDNEQAWTQTGQVFMGIGLAAAAGVGLAVTKFAQFDKQMSAVQAATLASAGEMEGLRKVAIKAGQDTAYSAQEAAGGIEQLAKAGVSTADIMGGGLAGSLALAAAGELDVADAAEIAASTMVQFNLEGNEVGRVADALAAGANKAQGSVADLGLALSYAGVPAAALGLSVEETTGVLGLFANAGITGEKAGTALRSMLVSLQNPSAKAATTMSELGIEVFDAEGNFVGMEATAGVLADKMGGLDQQTRGAALATIFGNEALGAATSLYNGGAGAVAEWTDAVSESGYAAQVAATRLDNLAGDITILKGSLETALIGLGESGSGPLREFTQDATTAVNALSSLPAGVQSTVLTLGTVTAGVGLLGGAFFLATPKILAANASLALMGPAGATAAAGLGAAARGLVALSGPLAILTGGGLVVLNYWMDNKQAIEGYAASLDQATGAVTDFTRESASSILFDAGAADAAKTLGLSMDTVTEAAIGNKDAIAEVDAVLAEHNGKVGEGTGLYGAWMAFGGKTTITMNEQGEAADLLSRQLGIQNERIAESRRQWGQTAEHTGEVIGAYTNLGTQVQTVGILSAETASSAQGMADGITATGEASDSAVGYVRLLGDVTGWTTEQVEAAQEEMDAWQESLGQTAAAFVEPLAVYKGLLDEKTTAEQEQAQSQADAANKGTQDSISAIQERAAAEIAGVEGSGKQAEKQKKIIQDRADTEVDALNDQTASWEDYVDDVSVSLDEYAADLEEQNKNQEKWRDNLIRVASHGRAGVVEQLAAMGPEGAEIVAKMAAANKTEFDRMADAMVTDAAFANEGSIDQFVIGAAVMERVGRDGAKATAEGIAKELGIGVDEVAGIASKYGVTLASGVNPLLKSLGRPPVPLTGGIPRPFADGGFHEDHTAQIAPAGAWRTWAEPETGGEALLPLRRARVPHPLTTTTRSAAA